MVTSFGKVEVEGDFRYLEESGQVRVLLYTLFGGVSRCEAG